ncbi:hypothetical protein GGR56DRAFT_641991 [Xylariaceae sp. FL0804]|nr:hypothetical protein GGR56DRAFT_641991 [Xylariaceae sp. FL0804]
MDGRVFVCSCLRPHVICHPESHFRCWDVTYGNLPQPLSHLGEVDMCGGCMPPSRLPEFEAQVFDSVPGEQSTPDRGASELYLIVWPNRIPNDLFLFSTVEFRSPLRVNSRILSHLRRPPGLPQRLCHPENGAPRLYRANRPCGSASYTAVWCRASGGMPTGQRIRHAKQLEYIPRIGADADPGAHFAQLTCLFIDRGFDVGDLVEGDGGGEATGTPADYGDPKGVSWKVYGHIGLYFNVSGELHKVLFCAEVVLL